MDLKFIYILFIGILLAIFVGVGIEAFYPQPPIPTCWQNLNKPLTPEQTQTPEYLQSQERCNQEYNGLIQEHNKNVSIIAIVGAVIFLVISLVFLAKIALISDSILLGGVLTLLYSIVHGFNVGDNMFRFILVTVGVVVALGLGYLKFVKPHNK